MKLLDVLHDGDFYNDFQLPVNFLNKTHSLIH